MADQYINFTDMVNDDIDFMSLFKSGKFCKDVNDLFKSEAKSLASIIVGGE